MLLLVVTSLEQFSVVFLASVDAYAQAISAEARSVPSCGTPPSPQQEGARECPACSCPPPPCPQYGPRGFDVPLGRGWRRVRAEQPPDTSARWALAAGHARRGPGRSVAVDPASVWAWGERASWPWRALTAWLGDTVPSTEGHVDAWWRVGRQQEAPLPVAAKGLALSGAAWGWSACAPAGRLVAAFPW